MQQNDNGNASKVLPGVFLVVRKIHAFSPCKSKRGRTRLHRSGTEYKPLWHAFGAPLTDQVFMLPYFVENGILSAIILRFRWKIWFHSLLLGNFCPKHKTSAMPPDMSKNRAGASRRRPDRSSGVGRWEGFSYCGRVFRA